MAFNIFTELCSDHHNLLLHGLFSSCSEQGLLVVAASLVVEHCPKVCELRAAACGFNSCRSQALEHRLSSCDTQA